MEITSGIGLLLSVFLLIIGILWFLLPFAVFGTKDRLSELIAAQQRTNEELAAIRKHLIDQHSPNQK